MRLSVIPAFFLISLVYGSAGQAADYLYTPQQVQDGVNGDGVLVREVTIRKGDTLSALSKRFAGRGYYYPQILLFSEVRNPHRIYPGQVVRVPLARTSGRQVIAPAVPHQAEQQVVLPAVARDQTVKPPEVEQKPAARISPNEKKLFNAAHAAMRKGRCTSAITQFDRFIARYPSSALLPEAVLYRAECYLKLSEK